MPLGVKAIVEAIYEPPQENFQDGMQLQEDPNESNINAVAKLCGLEIVGMIYSDCVDDGTGEGKVLCKRHGESWFMSSSESIFCAKMQEKFKVKSRYSRGGVFGSRFVNVIVSGWHLQTNIRLYILYLCSFYRKRGSQHRSLLLSGFEHLYEHGSRQHCRSHHRP